jgi:hypothetical protein
LASRLFRNLQARKRSFPRWGIAESANQDFGFAFSLEFDKAAEEFAN